MLLQAAAASGWVHATSDACAGIGAHRTGAHHHRPRRRLAGRGCYWCLAGSYIFTEVRARRRKEPEAEAKETQIEHGGGILTPPALRSPLQRSGSFPTAQPKQKRVADITLSTTEGASSGPPRSAARRGKEKKEHRARRIRSAHKEHACPLSPPRNSVLAVAD